MAYSSGVPFSTGEWEQQQVSPFLWMHTAATGVVLAVALVDVALQFPSAVSRLSAVYGPLRGKHFLNDNERRRMLWPSSSPPSFHRLLPIGLDFAVIFYSSAFSLIQGAAVRPRGSRTKRNHLYSAMSMTVSVNLQ